MKNSYWNQNGKFQKEYKELWERLVPGQGKAATKAGEVLRAMSKLYFRWYNDGDKIENSMPDWREKESATRAFCYIYSFRDKNCGFIFEDLMFNLAASLTEDDYETALEAAADAIIAWAAKQPDTPNEDAYLDDKFLGKYEFDFYREDEDGEEW